ncbi:MULTISPECIES: hypothetical protein [unclassified Microbacterium]|nr:MULTISPECIES: hypothetical protein [unclassified Microbacterium]
MTHYINGIHLPTGQLEIDQMPTISGVQPNVYVDSNGVFYRIT